MHVSCEESDIAFSGDTSGDADRGGQRLRVHSPQMYVTREFHVKEH